MHRFVPSRVGTARSGWRLWLGIGMLLVGIGVLLAGAPTPTRANVLADLPTRLPATPTDAPNAPNPTSPPDATQPPDLAPTDPPDQQPGATDPAQPGATSVPAHPSSPNHPKKKQDKDPTATATPEPSSTPVPPSPTPVPRVEIRVRKVVNTDTAHPGDTVSYTVVVENIGEGTAYDVALTDPVPPQLDVTNLGSGKGDIVVSGGHVTAYPSTLAPGESASYTITARVQAGTADGTVVNTAVATTSSPGDDPSNNTASAALRIVVPKALPAVAVRPPQPRMPHTADPDDSSPEWRLLPWTLLALAIVLVGSMMAWNMASTHSLNIRVGTALDWLRPRKRVTPEPVTAAQAGIVDPYTQVEAQEAARALLFTPPASASSGPRPLGEPFAEPPPSEPLPPPVALDRSAALRDTRGDG